MNREDYLSSIKPPGYFSVDMSPDPSRVSPASAYPTSPTLTTAVTPRAPVVHFYVCDNANARVRIVADQFIAKLIESGALVFVERFATHQPGYQVKASAVDTQADFFFQIHSKTAGPGHVRLYLNGQPKRMSLNDAVADMWFLWKLTCGALSKIQCDCISTELMKQALEIFAGITPENMKIENIQENIRKARDEPYLLSEVMVELDLSEGICAEARKKIKAYRPVVIDWDRPKGAEIQRIEAADVIRGLSQPLKDAIDASIERIQEKLTSLKNIANSMAQREQMDAYEYDSSGESTYIDNQWRNFVGSLSDETSSLRISSLETSESFTNMTNRVISDFQDLGF